MKVLVTGGAGFIASHIVDQLVEREVEVVVMDNLSTSSRQQVNERAIFYLSDITEPTMEEVFSLERPDVVIHHAAQIQVQQSLRNPFFDAEVNILGTIRLLECCRKYGVKKIVYASSAAVYGNPVYLGIDESHPIAPLSFYGLSKYTPESYIRIYANLYDINYTILRYANVYGIRQDPKGEGGVVSIFVDKLLRGESPVIFGDGEQTRDFIYVEDVAAANVCALTKGDREILNISTNHPTSLHQLLHTMNHILGTNILPIYQAERPGDIKHSYLQNEKAKRVLVWEPKYDLEKGLRKTFDFYQALYQNEFSFV
jgi:UDP-glucose 4-epimerase